MKSHLGDAVYAETDPYGGIILTAGDGESVSDRIVLEDRVIQNLEAFIKRMRE